jgi:hypothetical protein
MTQALDFEALTHSLVARIHGGEVSVGTRSALLELVRMVWNARGAVDIATIDVDLSSMMGAIKAGPYVKNLDRALRTLDR